MNTGIIELLDNINILYGRKNNINSLLELINKKEQPQVEITYGLYAIPNKPNEFKCVDDNIPHIKLSKFKKGNNILISNVLKKINADYNKNKVWTLLKTKVNNNNINSNTLYKLSDILTENNIENDRKYYINCITMPPNSAWYLTMVEKNGDTINFIGDKIQLHDITTNIKVLSYNVCYEAMQGTHTKCQKQINNNNICLNNLASFIKSNNPFDFIGLQEATNYENIVKVADLTNMGSVIKDSAEHMITLYNKDKYTLEFSMIGGMSGSTDIIKPDARPFTMLFFTQQICVFNMHGSHNNPKFGYSFFNFNEYLKTQLEGHNRKKEIIEKLKKYDIILMGDLNNKIAGNGNYSSLDNSYLFLKDPELVPNGRRLYGVTKENTCCDNNLKPTHNNVKFIADHILSTFKNIKNQVSDPISPASDHLPIIATITL